MAILFHALNRPVGLVRLCVVDAAWREEDFACFFQAPASAVSAHVPANQLMGEDIMSAAIEKRRFDTPDDKLDMKERGGIAILNMGTGATGMHAVFEPGWTWERDEKPLLGDPETCPMHHTGYCFSGTLVVRMVEADRETRIGAGDFFEIPPGHDAYVEGDDRVELILFAPPEHAH